MIDVIKTKKNTDKGVLYYRTCAYCGKTVSYYHTNKPTHCPFCGASDFVKPTTETKLFLLQKEYFDKGRDRSVLAKMFTEMKPYAESLIKKGPLRNFTYEYEDLEMKASEASSLIIEYYLTKPNFKIENSFAGYLKFKIKEVFYNSKDQNEDRNMSLNAEFNDMSGESSQSRELQDFTEKFHISSLFYDENKALQYEQDKKDLLKGLNKIINKIVETVEDEHNKQYSLFLIIGLLVRLKKRGVEDFYHYFGSEYKEFIDKALLLIYKFIKESQEYKKEWDHDE